MRNARKRTSSTIGVMLFIAIVILLIYYYSTNRTEPLVNNPTQNQTEVEKILNEDYINSYPGTPREVVKNFARIMRALYSDPKDDEIEPLAAKIRELYDDEFLANNPDERTNIWTNRRKYC